MTFRPGAILQHQKRMSSPGYTSRVCQQKHWQLALALHQGRNRERVKIKTETVKGLKREEKNRAKQNTGTYTGTRKAKGTNKCSFPKGMQQCKFPSEPANAPTLPLNRTIRSNRKQAKDQREGKTQKDSEVSEHPHLTNSIHPGNSL